MKVFLDANVLYDALFAREPFAESAWKIMGLATQGKVQLVTSTLTVVNAVYIAKKYDIPLGDVKNSLSQMHGFITFADITEGNVAEQLEGGWKDFEDAVQHCCALESFADSIVTRNKKDFSQSLIPVESPEELLGKLRQT